VAFSIAIPPTISSLRTSTPKTLTASSSISGNPLLTRKAKQMDCISLRKLSEERKLL
jgi:hypothetical protein